MGSLLPGGTVKRHETKARYATEQIREAIRHGVLAPGSRIDIDGLGKQMGMSATPVREALRQLEAEGLLVSEPHLGVSVAKFTPSDTASLYELRAVLESLATRLAIEKLTDKRLEELQGLEISHEKALEEGDNTVAANLNEDWHMRLYSGAADVPHLIDFIRRLWHDPRSATWLVPGRSSQSRADHAEIMTALRERDAERAAELMRAHILAGRRLVVEHLSGQQDLSDLTPVPAASSQMSRPGVIAD